MPRAAWDCFCSELSARSSARCSRAGWDATFGVGRAYAAAVVVECAALLLLPLATLTPIPIVVVVTAFVVNGMGLGLTNVYAVTLRQAVTPEQLLGRMNLRRDLSTSVVEAPRDHCSRHE